jgi:predicted metal-dependent hydrolase
MNTQIQLGDVTVDVVLKNIKNIHLSVYPPVGRVRVAAPKSTNPDTLRVFIISKLEWIKHQQERFRKQARETKRDYINRESHYLWGKRYLLTVSEQDAVPTIKLTPTHLLLQVPPQTCEEKKQALVAEWYRRQLKTAVRPLLIKWQAILGVKVERFFVQRMKTRWGSCNPRAHTIRLNTELAKKPAECLEYVMVHELVHLLEPTHNARFTELMDRFIPQWQVHRKALNSLPIGGASSDVPL